MTFHPQAAKEFGKLDGQTKRQVQRTIDALATGDPTQTHWLDKPLQGWQGTKASRGHRIVHKTTDDGGLHIGYVGLHDYEKAERRLGVREPFEFEYARNTVPAPDMGAAYGQDIEPHGRYMTVREPKGNYVDSDRMKWEFGQHRFENPLHLDAEGWKERLSDMHGGKTGRELSQAVRDAGHDGIVTHETSPGRSFPGEIVDLTGFQRRSKMQRAAAAEYDEGDTDYRMQHRPPDEDYGAPHHDLSGGGLIPEDVYTHPHYYGDMSDPTVREAHYHISRTRGKPEAKVRIYRSLPAEHADQGFRPGDWVTTSKEYARQHGMQEDSKHDWPVISAMVRAKHLHTAGDDFREWGYNGTETKRPMISYKGGYHQEVSNRADGSVVPVKRRKPKEAAHDPYLHPRTDQGHFNSFRNVWGSSRGNSWAITGASAHLMNIPGFHHNEEENWTGTAPERLRLAHSALHAIHKSSGSPHELFHGTMSPRVKKLQPGDDVKLPLTATTGSDILGQAFAHQGSEHGSVMHFPKGTKIFGQSENKSSDGTYSWRTEEDPSDAYQWDEAITAGHFKVKHREEDDEGHTHLHMEHLGTFNPHTRSWEYGGKTASLEDDMYAGWEPHQRAVSEAQEAVRAEHPYLTAPLPEDMGERDEELRKVLRQGGHPQADDAYVHIHRDPNRNSSNSGISRETGAPVVALHQSRADRGTILHESAHILNDHEHGRQVNEEAPDHYVHGVRFAQHYARLLQPYGPRTTPGGNYRPGAGDLFLNTYYGSLAKQNRGFARTAARAIPTDRIFGPTYGLDHRLFDGDKLKGEVIRDVMERLDQVLRVDSGLVGSDWMGYIEVYLAGSEASEWTSPSLEGNDDFDTLLGIDYAESRGHDGRGASAQWIDKTDSEIDDVFNDVLRRMYNDENWLAPFGGTWHLTGYVNEDAYDIRKIKPYAAYDLNKDAWAVKPPHLPSWGPESFPEGPALWHEAEAVADYADSILELPEPYRTQQGSALYDHLHSDRRRAFGDNGEGWYDPGNVIEKYLDQLGLWARLLHLKKNAEHETFDDGEQPMLEALANSDGDRYVTCDQGHEHWGSNGAAGLLIKHRGEDGKTRYLLQKRSPWVDHGNTWSIPGGAIGSGETPRAAAHRESEEELGSLPPLEYSHTTEDDHGGWKYHTVVAESPERFSPAGGGEDDDEHEGHGWFTHGEINDLPLHPGFRKSWDRVRTSHPGNVRTTYLRTADHRLQHQAPDADSGKPMHHYTGDDPDDLVDIYRAAPHDVRHLGNDSWVTTNPEYAHQHAEQYDASDKWPVLHAQVPQKHVFWDENDPNEHGYQGPDIHEADVHDQETGEPMPREDYDDQHPQPSQEDHERGREMFHGTAVHLPPRAHEIVHNPAKPKDVRANILLRHLPKETQHNEHHSGMWEDDADDAELEAMDQGDSLGKHPVHGTPATQVVVHGSQWADKPHGISWADSSKEPLVFSRDYEHHTFGGKTAVVNSVERWGSPSLDFKTQNGKRKGISHTTITAHDKGEKVGHVRLTEGGSEVDDLHVHPARRGEGIGHALMDQAIDQFGHNTLRLHASPFGKDGLEQDPLMDFYSSHGFEPEESRGRGYMIRRPRQAEGVRRTAMEGWQNPEQERADRFDATDLLSRHGIHVRSGGPLSDEVDDTPDLENTIQIHPDQPLHTEQGELNRKVLEHYRQHGPMVLHPPTTQRDHSDPELPNRPTVVTYQGRHWLTDGHHRALVHRERNEPFTAWHVDPDREQREYEEWERSRRRAALESRQAVDATGSMMVALVPPDHVIDHLVQEDGEDADELHITLLYLGKESAFTPKQIESLPTLISQWAKTQKPLKAETQGAGTFLSKDNHKDSHVLWASVNIPGITRVHDGLVDFLRGHGLTIKENFGYIPHITLKYDKYHVRFLPKITPMSWDVTEVYFCRGDEWVPYRLGR